MGRFCQSGRFNDVCKVKLYFRILNSIVLQSRAGFRNLSQVLWHTVFLLPSGM